MSKGFTIIEVVVAIFILSIAVIGVYNAFSIVVILTADTTDRFTAAYLTQEGMEIVRNIRDNNWVTGIDWKTGLADADTNCQNGCQADYTTGTLIITPFIIEPWSGSGKYLNLNIDAGGFYSYNTVNNKETKFKRKITIEPVVGYEDYIMHVSVQVSWDEKATILGPGSKAGDSCISTSSNCLTAEEYLYNWY